MRQIGEDYSRILIIGDNLSDRQLLSDTLLQVGYQVQSVSSGEQAVRLIETETPDLFLLDVALPDIDSYTVCQHLKVSDLTQNIPVIFVGSIDTAEEQAKCFSVGAADCISRPFHPELVLARVAAHLSIRNLEDKLRERTRELNRANALFKREITQRKRAEKALAEKQHLSRLFDDALQQDRLNQINNRQQIMTTDVQPKAEQRQMIEGGGPTPTIFLDEALHNLPVAASVVGEDGTIHEVNQIFQNLVGYSRQELKHQNIALFFANDDLCAVSTFLRKVAENRATDSVIAVLHRQRGDIDVRIRALRIQNHNLGACRLFMMVEGLSHQIIVDPEKELDALKLRFAAMVSHEFRTPLATIQAAIDALQNYFDKMSPEQRMQRFHKIRNQIMRVTTLLDNVLTLQTVEIQSRVLNPTQFDLSILLGELVSEYSRINSSRTLTYVSMDQHDYPIKADQDLLTRGIANLILNAIHYSAEDTPVQVNLSRHQDSHYVIQVVDSGVGILLDEQKHVFSDFFRGSNSTGVPGVGLGLAITKKAVERHGGTIQLESNEGSGSTFTVILPEDYL